MIGRTDITIPTTAGSSALEACLRVIHRFWPEAVFEDIDGDTSAKPYDEFPIGTTKELFAFENATVAPKWEAKGADPSLSNTMIHVLVSEKSITLVVDDPTNGTIARILASIRSVLGGENVNLEPVTLRSAVRLG